MSCSNRELGIVDSVEVRQKHTYFSGALVNLGIVAEQYADDGIREGA